MIRKDDKLIADKVRICKSYMSKGMGLRFKLLKKGEAYVFPFKSPQKPLMDMVFVFYPIDVIFLDADKKVIETKIKFLPFSLYMPRKEATYIIELENGSISKNNIRIGDTISF